MMLKRTLAAVAMSLAAIGCSQADGDSGGAGSTGTTFVKGDVILGDANAPVKIVEYASTTCSHCRNFHKTVLPGIKSAFIDTGKANLVFRDLPTYPAPVAAAGGSLARCAGADKYYEVLDDIFTNQYEVMQASQAGGAIEEFVKIGGRHGMSAEQVNACLQDPDVKDEIIRTETLANDNGVSSTPTLFINGKRVEAEDMSAEGLKRLIDQQLGAPAEDGETAPETAETPDEGAETPAE